YDVDRAGGHPIPTRGERLTETTSSRRDTGPAAPPPSRRRVRPLQHTPRGRGGEAVDTEALRALIEWYLGEGLHGIFVNGTTGEWFSQSADERRLVAETAIDQVGGRGPGAVGSPRL